VQEAAVSSARPLAADGRFQDDNVERRLALPQRQRSPQAGVAPADDRDVDPEVALERRRRLEVSRLVGPPRPRAQLLR
jgi:hypothetical protein